MASGKLPASRSSSPALRVPPSGTGTAWSLTWGAVMPIAAAIGEAGAAAPLCSVK